MRCKKCGVKWITGNQTPMPKECPVCNNNLTAGLSALEPDTIAELLYYLISEMGKDILHAPKKICAYMDDIFPNKREDRIVWESLFENHLGNYLFKWIKRTPPTKDVDKVVERISKDKIRDDFYHDIYFLIGIDKILGSRFDTPDYYLSVYESLSDYCLKKQTLVKANNKCHDNRQLDILWNLVALEEEHQDVDIEHHLQTLVKLKDQEALLKLVHLFESGRLIKRDRTKAFELLHEYEYLADEEILYQLGRYYGLGWSGTINSKISEDYFCRAAEKGSAKAQYQLYNLYVNNPVQIKSALQYLLQAAEQKYPPAVHQLAIHIFYGKGVEMNVYKAVNLLQENVKKGFQASAGKLEYFNLLLKEKEDAKEDSSTHENVES